MAKRTPGGDDLGGDADVVIYSDGACRGNPGPGAYGTIVVRGGQKIELTEFFRKTTNNRMELLGAIRGLETLKVPSRVRVVSDSKLLITGMTEWLPGWIRNGWKKADRTPVKNREYWERLHELAAPHRVAWVWVRGHNGHPENTRCDNMANETLDLNLDHEPPADLSDEPSDEARDESSDRPSDDTLAG